MNYKALKKGYLESCVKRIQCPLAHQHLERLLFVFNISFQQYYYNFHHRHVPFPHRGLKVRHIAFRHPCILSCHTVTEQLALMMSFSLPPPPPPGEGVCSGEPGQPAGPAGVSGV